MKTLDPNDIVFISGPMTGQKDFNRPAFFEAEEIVKDSGAVIKNPAHLPDGHPWEWYMRECLKMLAVSTAILQLPGWENSQGARLENKVAEKLRLKLVSLENA